jgi:hypothetical protein
MRGAGSAAAFLATLTFAGLLAAQPGGPPPAANPPPAERAAGAPLAPREDAATLADGARRQLLTRYVGEYVRRENVGEVIGYVQAVLALGLGVIGIATIEDDLGFGATSIATGAVSTALVGGSFLASRDTRVDILQVNSQLVGGGAALSLGLMEYGDVPPLSAFAGAGAAFVTAGLQTINFASRRASISKLRRHSDRLSDGRPSDAELDGIERDFEQGEMPISYQVLAIPYGVGAAVALAPALDDGTSDKERTWSYLFAGSMSLACIFALITPNLVPAYRDQATGLDVVAGPTNLDVRYRF